MVLIIHVYFQLECSLRAQRIQLAEMEENLTSLSSMSNAGDSVALDATQELEDLVSWKSGRLSVLMFFFINVVPSSEETYFNHLLWSVFQSSFTQFYMLQFIFMDLCVQLTCTACIRQHSNSEKIHSLDGIWTHDLPSCSIWSRWLTNVPPCFCYLVY